VTSHLTMVAEIMAKFERVEKFHVPHARNKDVGKVESSQKQALELPSVFGISNSQSTLIYELIRLRSHDVNWYWFVPHW
jgi:hypothetical protein